LIAEVGADNHGAIIGTGKAVAVHLAACDDPVRAVVVWRDDAVVSAAELFDRDLLGFGVNCNHIRILGFLVV